MPRVGNSSTIPERNKRPGVAYAWTADGVELPVIDVSHPAFRLDLDDAALEELTQNALREMEGRARLPRFMQRLIYLIVLRGSVLAGHISRSRGGHLEGLPTYLLKLGPENLGAGYAKEIDRTIAATLPCVSMRLRLQILARLIADELMDALDRNPGLSLRFISVGGGVASESLNALILLYRERPELLRRRRVSIDVLDRDDRAPFFGARALEALCLPGGVLEGLEATLRYRRYDWSRPQTLEPLIGDCSGEILSTASEGGLLDYGSDEEIIENLRAIGELVAPGSVFAGTISRGDGYRGRFNAASGAALVLRDPDDCARLAGRAGWKLKSVEACPLCFVVCLEKG